MAIAKPLRDGVQELRIDHGPGYRVYLEQALCRAGAAAAVATQGSQSREIARAPQPSERLSEEEAVLLP